MKLKNQSQASAQLERMADAAKGLKSTEANNELLYMQTAFDYTFGNNKAGDESMQKLITVYMYNKQYDAVIDFYQTLINLSEMANRAKLTSMMYQNFLLWRDPINSATSRE